MIKQVDTNNSGTIHYGVRAGWLGYGIVLNMRACWFCGFASLYVWQGDAVLCHDNRPCMHALCRSSLK